MKKTLLLTFVAIGLVGALVAFKVPANHASALVEQYEGIYIFSDCKPTEQYEYLGTVTSNTAGFGSPQYEDVRDRLIRNGKKAYPEGQAIILHLKSGATDKGDMIRFKD